MRFTMDRGLSLTSPTGTKGIRKGERRLRPGDLKTDTCRLCLCKH